MKSVEIKKKDLPDYFGVKIWRPPGERIDPYAQSIVDLWVLLDENWSPEGILDFSLPKIMERFGNSLMSYPGFKNKQQIAVDKINRNGWYPGYHVDVFLTTNDWSFWYQRTKVGEGKEEEPKDKRPFYRKGDSIVVGDQEIDPQKLEGADFIK